MPSSGQPRRKGPGPPTASASYTEAAGAIRPGGLASAATPARAGFLHIPQRHPGVQGRGDEHMLQGSARHWAANLATRLPFVTAGPRAG